MDNCQERLKAIATAIKQYHPAILTKALAEATPLIRSVARAIYYWGTTPAQPRLTIIQGQKDPGAILTLPFTSALSGAYNGENVIRQAIEAAQSPPASLIGLINHFAHQHFLQWLGCLSAPLATSSLAPAIPSVMPRRSGLKLISQQYDGQVF
jgi:hypothetical protein